MRTRTLPVLLLALVAVLPVGAAEPPAVPANPAPEQPPLQRLTFYLTIWGLADALLNDARRDLLTQIDAVVDDRNAITTRPWAYKTGVVIGRLDTVATMLGPLPLPSPDFAACDARRLALGKEMHRLLVDLRQAVEVEGGFLLCCFGRRLLRLLGSIPCLLGIGFSFAGLCFRLGALRFLSRSFRALPRFGGLSFSLFTLGGDPVSDGGDDACVVARLLEAGEVFLDGLDSDPWNTIKNTIKSFPSNPSLACNIPLSGTEGIGRTFGTIVPKVSRQYVVSS